MPSKNGDKAPGRGDRLLGKHVWQEQTRRAAKEHLLLNSRCFFKDEFEETLIRPLAISLRLIPSSQDFKSMSRSDLKNKARESNCDWLDEAFTEDSDGVRSVRGSGGELFPEADGPNCKYSALFDKRQMFVGERKYIIEHGDQEKPFIFIRD